VRVAEALERFQKLTRVIKLRLGPESVATRINDLLDDPSFVCECRTRSLKEKTPLRDVSDRATNFRLETAGWRNFMVYAEAVHRDGHETPLPHDLVLRYPDGTLAVV